MDCTLQLHANDLNTVVNYFRKKGVKKNFISGHSFANLIIFSSRNQDFDGVVLWDPSYKFSFIKSSKWFNKILNPTPVGYFPLQ